MYAKLVAFSLCLLSLNAIAEDAPANAPSEPPPPVQEPAPVPAAAAPTKTSAIAIPNDRELSSENYQLLGRLVWQQLQKNPDRAKSEYSNDEINKLIDEMHRNRGEIGITLDDLWPLLENGCQIKKSIPGVQLEDIGKLFK